MSHREANLAVLRRLHPETARLVEALPTIPPRGAWSVSRAGPPSVRLRETLLTSTYDPVAEALKAVPDWDDAVDFVVVAGFGAGYLAEAVAIRHTDLPIILAEEDPQWFSEVLEFRDLTSLWSNPLLTVLLGPAEILADFLRGWSCRTVEVLSWRPLTALSPHWSSLVAEQVALAQALARVNLATYSRFAELWRRNLTKNEASKPSWSPVGVLENLCRGTPAVVAAAGPSLADSFEWIEAHRQQMVLIAVDTAWPALAAQGLEPDVLVVLDGQYWNSRHVDRHPGPATLVVTEWIGPPRAFRLASHTYVAASSVPFLRKREVDVWGTLGELPSGGSVSTAAFSLALLLGCREVAFAGLDLGYPAGLTHVKGSQFAEALHRNSRRLSPAETRGWGLRGPGLSKRPSVTGGTVLSDPRMDIFRDWISASVRRSSVQTVNLSTRGSLVPGLVPPPAGYGDDWPLTQRRPPPKAPSPHIRDESSAPPFDLFERVIIGSDFGAAIEAAWDAARVYWGDSVWETWAGRAKRTWDRWPSVRSRRALEEVVSLTLDWRRFWDKD